MISRKESRADRGMDHANVDSMKMWYRIARRFSGRRDMRVTPHPGPTPEADQPVGLGGKSGTLRAAIFGINDGLLTNLSLIMGVTGASVQNKFIIVAGVAGLLAGAFSMGTGEFVSMTAQRELFERLLHIEAHELATEPDEENEELKKIYEGRGFPSHLAQQVVEVVMRDPQIALETHAREELGLDPDELGSPWGAAISSFTMFAIGASIPLVPFLIGSGTAAALAAILASALALFGVGAGMSVFTGRSLWWSGARILLLGGLAAGITFGVGRALHVNV